MTLKTIAYRLPQDLIDRIDAYAAMRARVDGRPCSRSVAIRALLEKALGPPAAEVIEVESKVIEPVRTETIRGNITDPPFEPEPKKKKQPPHRRQDRIPGAAFDEAKKKKDKWPGV